MYIFIDHFACAVHSLGDEPFKAILELCDYLKQNIREDRYPGCWFDFPNSLFEECVFEGMENELFKCVETLNFWAEPYRADDRPAIFMLRVIPTPPTGIMTF
jgi:hypothetical protein